MVNKYYKKKTKKSFKNKHVKDIKIFLKNKNANGEKGPRQISKSSCRTKVETTRVYEKTLLST